MPISLETPVVTIGMPVYNGTAYIEQALAALLDQTYRNFTLLVSDNGSNDGTWEILQGWAARDQRIVLHRQASNIGALPNFRYVLDLAQTEYFMWHAHDDWLAPSYLEELVGLVTAEPDCALACGAIQPHVDDGPRRRRTPALDLEGAGSRLQRVIRMLRQPEPSWIYGLFRREPLRQALRLGEEFGYVWAADHLELLPFILNDSVRSTDRAILYKRKNEISGQLYRPDTVVRQLRFFARYLRFHVRVFRASDLTLGEKLRCLPWLLLHAVATTHVGAYKRFVKHPVKRAVKALVSGPARAFNGRR